jgi:hypothetical protein
LIWWVIWCVVGRIVRERFIAVGIRLFKKGDVNIYISMFDEVPQVPGPWFAGIVAVPVAKVKFFTGAFGNDLGD